MRAGGFTHASWPNPRAFSRRGGGAAKAAGFTLLEMIVVLAVLGLATALVAPTAIRGIDSWRRQAAMDELVDAIRGLPGQARSRGKTIAVDDASLASATPPLRIGGDWTLAAPTPWQVRANGVCEGGTVLVRNPFGERSIAVSAPFCDARITP